MHIDRTVYDWLYRWSTYGLDGQGCSLTILLTISEEVINIDKAT
jgi:hypothetical protein